MRRLVLIAALALAGASAQAGGTRSLSGDATPNDTPVVTKGASKSSVLAADSRSLSNGATTNDLTATTNTPPKPGAVSAQTGGTAATGPTAAPQAVETPRYAPPPGLETPRNASPPAPPATEPPKPVDTTRNTEPAQMPTQTQTPAQTPRYTARPAPVDNAPVATTPPSTRQHMPSREARDWHSRARHADYYGSGWSDYGWDYRRPRFRTPHWSTRRIIAALHRYGFFW